MGRSSPVYKLTVRHGARVERERYEDLRTAVAALQRRADQIAGEGPLAKVKMLREFEPGERVAARLEVSTGGLLRSGRAAGVDVMGDGSVVAFAGGVRRQPLAPRGTQTPFDAVKRELERAEA